MESKDIIMNRIQIVVAALLLTVAFGGSALAQLDPSIKFNLYENGSHVGEVFVPERAADALTYTEHWVLYKNYQYPGPRFIGALLIAPMPSMAPYADETEFFRTAPFPEGSTYIKVDSVEYDALPGRR
jgi:hypothetical protein